MLLVERQSALFFLKFQEESYIAKQFDYLIQIKYN